MGFSSFDERECIQIDANAKHSSPNASSIRALRFSATSLNRRSEIWEPGGKVPGSRLVIGPALTAPWAVPAGIVAIASIVPVLAHPVAASADTVVHWESTRSMSLPCGKVDTSTSPVVRHGISVWPLFQRRPSRLSSNVIAAVPVPSSRVKARYRNVSRPGWSTAPHASRMLTLPGVTPPASVVASQSPGWSTFDPPTNAVSCALSSGACTTRPAACSACQSM